MQWLQMYSVELTLLEDAKLYVVPKLTSESVANLSKGDNIYA